MLAESQINGGAGYTFEQIGNMTPDQIFMRLLDHKLLAKRRSVSVTEALQYVKRDEKGRVKVRDDQGNIVWLPLR